MTESVTDNEWAAGVMGWTRHPTFPSVWVTYSHAGFFNTRSGGDWNPDTDANDFRSLLNCEAVRGWAAAWLAGEYSGVSVENYLGARFLAYALTDQPAALKRLRNAVEGQS